MLLVEASAAAEAARLAEKRATSTLRATRFATDKLQPELEPIW
jgi:hypothetical protein